MENVVLWGLGEDYRVLFSNILQLHEECAHFKVIAYVDREKKSVNGRTVIRPEELVIDGYEYDHIICTAPRFYSEIIEDGRKLGIERKYFIRGDLFQMSGFDWSSYLRLRNNPPSLVTEFCFGGHLFHNLDLPFRSPFVNTRVGGIKKDDVWEIVEHIDEYMDIKPTEKADSTFLNELCIAPFTTRISYPVLWLHDVCLHGFHYRTLQEFYDTWEKRRARYQKDNRCIIKVLYDDSDVERFCGLNEPRKLGIYYKETERNDILTFTYDQLSECYYWGSYTNRLFSNMGEITKYINVKNIVSFLLGDEYKKETMVI